MFLLGALGLPVAVPLAFLGFQGAPWVLPGASVLFCLNLDFIFRGHDDLVLRLSTKYGALNSSIQSCGWLQAPADGC